MKQVLSLVLALMCFALVGAEEGGVRFSASDKPFIPKGVPKAQASVKLRILPGKNMAFASATLEGRECNLLFDTGATHTTFDIGFIRRELPNVKLEGVTLGGVSNVEGAPKVFHAHSFNLGDAEFREFDAMALDISGLTSGIGVKVDGVIGMNVIGCIPALVSFGARKVVFMPDKEECDGFGEGIARFRGDPMSVAMVPTIGDKKFGLIVDSAATFTFLDKSLGWPSTGESVGIGAIDVNGNGAIKAEKGRTEKLKLGMDVEISPLLVAEPMNRIGADTLLAYDMLIDLRQVRFRKFKKD